MYAGSALILTGTQFLSNTAALYGGGALLVGAATLNGGLFQSNTGAFGGGLLAGSTLTLTGTRLLSNTASSDGGGAYAYGAATLNGGLFRNNAVAGNGGGLLAGNTLALTGTQFIGNAAGTDGGGLYLNTDTANTKQVVNALFARNRAAGNGAAIFVNAAPFNLIHTTIVSPTAPSGGTQAVYVLSGTAYVTNTLIASHTVGIQQAGGTVTEWNTLYAGVGAPRVGAVATSGSLTGTAAFVNPAADDYHLMATSAAVDAGTPPIPNVTTDFDGDDRPQQGGYDIGYDESPYKPFYTLTVASAGTGSGAITPTVGVYTYTYGALVTPTASANTGSTYTGWSGACAGTGECGVIMNSDREVTATFMLNTYTITPTAGANGSITPGVPQTVDFGASLAFTITPDAGYTVADVGVDGISQGALSNFAFTNITADHTITATFSEIPPTPSPAATNTPSPTPTPTPTPTSSPTATNTVTPTPTATPPVIKVRVYVPTTLRASAAGW